MDFHLVHIRVSHLGNFNPTLAGICINPNLVERVSIVPYFEVRGDGINNV